MSQMCSIFIFMKNVKGADLDDVQLLGKYDKENLFILFIFVEVFRKYTWVILFKDKKGRRITKAFQKALNLSGCKAKE